MKNLIEYCIIFIYTTCLFLFTIILFVALIVIIYNIFNGRLIKYFKNEFFNND